MKVDFITSYESAGAEIAYPLIKWRRLLKKHGLDIDIRHCFEPGNLRRADVLVLTHPFYRDSFPLSIDWHKLHKGIEQRLKQDLKQARNNWEKIVFFDTSDSTASAYFSFLKDVDLILKWQVLVDRSYYLSETYENRGCIWTDADKKIRSRADPNHIDRLAVGWNLAYRNYSLLRKGARHLHWRGITWNPIFAAVARERPILCTFRGALSGSRSKHRQQAVQALSDPALNNVVLGPPINRWSYLRELERSKTVVSPFGFGEPCYRDMEAFIHGAILVKPSMDHLETFPNVYLANETYVPVKWDFADLAPTLKEIEAQYADFLHIAQRGQAVYREYAENGEHFVLHLVGLIETLYR